MERFTISLDDKLAHEFDHWIADRGYANRSEAVRDLLRAEMERTRQNKDESVHCVACLSYIFNHHQRELTERITELQHDHHDLAVSTMHAHLDHDHCLETVILRGPTLAVRRFADAVCAERGVHHASSTSSAWNCTTATSTDAARTTRRTCIRSRHPEPRRLPRPT
ncbi:MULTISPECIES: nickel-responsive transcriptional regulator NikR [unclassified Methylibium]|uniref:nickel-responsive transcriptional regulator NikR n=1 Tax=unclassified Methylibium TaxID=2633235 RepID=UPI0003F3CF24|nr:MULTISPECIES: nickel-responsive transcriptional regulator NikR [unclassified Methylibium]EWS56936.1 Nickel-responsive regulator [Methylibium sp. T29]EWS60830.1 Nickel-responsive regulator [Methylibium sp. T29-B]